MGKLRGLDLFSGIGGITCALAPWVEPVAYCEIDRYATGVLLSRMADGQLPVAPIWDDVRTLEPLDVDIIYGGFPCQDISVAGLGAGLAGERSGLVFEVLRLVAECRPAFVFLENVPAIRTRGGERVVKELAALGYDCRWDVLSAYDMGAPHKRERWFLLAHSHRREVESQRDGHQPKGGGALRRDADGFHHALADASAAGSSNRDAGSRGKSGPTRRLELERLGVSLADPHHQGLEVGIARDTGERPSSFREGWWGVEPDVGRVAYGVRGRVDRIKSLGNAVVPPQAREAFIRLMGLPSEVTTQERVRMQIAITLTMTDDEGFMQAGIKLGTIAEEMKRLGGITTEANNAAAAAGAAATTPKGRGRPPKVAPPPTPVEDDEFAALDPPEEAGGLDFTEDDVPPAAGPSGKTPPEPARAKPATRAAATAKPAVTLPDVQSAFMEYAKANGREKATLILQRFGVKKSAELTPAQWPQALRIVGA